MSEMATVLGVGTPVEYQGFAYEIGPLPIKLRPQLEAWLKNQAWAEVESLRGTVSEEVYQERYAAMTALIGAKFLKFGSKGFLQALQSPDAFCYTLYLWLKNRYPERVEITPAWVEGFFTAKGPEIINRLRDYDTAATQAVGTGPNG